MKKWFSLLLVVFMLVGCKKEVDVDSAPEKLINSISQLESYKTTCEMVINRDDKTIKFDVEVDYLTPSYYKVTFENADNNSKQIIVKNDDGVYALTPALGKEFKFESEWPLNSSHAYLLTGVIEDIKNDTSAKSSLNGTDVVIQSKISHKTNSKLAYQKVILSSKLVPKSVSFYTEDNKEVIKVNYISFVKNVNLTKGDFNVSKIMEDSVSNLGEGSVASVEGSLVVSYVADGYTLKTSSTEATTIMTYSKDQSVYTVICQDVIIDETNNVSRIYKDFELTDIGIAYVNENSMMVHYQNKEVMVISQDLSDLEMVEIINSIKFA